LPFSRLLVASCPALDLLLFAKYLFVDASASGKLNPGLNTRRHHAMKVKKLGGEPAQHLE
jgi:hypothetical protein